MIKAILSATMLFVLSSGAFGQVTTEKLKIVWPEEYKWKLVSDIESGFVRVHTLVPANEKIDKWTIMGEMMKIWGARDVSMDSVMTKMFNTAKQKCAEGNGTAY